MVVTCGGAPWLYQNWPGGFMVFVVQCPGKPEGSIGSASGLKASQKTGQPYESDTINCYHVYDIIF